MGDDGDGGDEGDGGGGGGVSGGNGKHTSVSESHHWRGINIPLKNAKKFSRNSFSKGLLFTPKTS